MRSVDESLSWLILPSAIRNSIAASVSPCTSFRTCHTPPSYYDKRRERLRQACYIFCTSVSVSSGSHPDSIHPNGLQTDELQICFCLNYEMISHQFGKGAISFNTPDDSWNIFSLKFPLVYWTYVGPLYDSSTLRDLRGWQDHKPASGLMKLKEEGKNLNCSGAIGTTAFFHNKVDFAEIFRRSSPCSHHRFIFGWR